MGTADLDTPTDADLVLAAQAGDVSALGLLIARHRPVLLAVAISLLGYGPDAEDAVQEASLIALRRIGDLRNPRAAGPWLRTVVRNACRMKHRSPAGLRLGDGLAATLRSSEPDPAKLLEQHATRDWVWHALEDLSPPLRLVVMLRYFTGVTAYEDIANACGVPVGTVRSRLNEARGRLAGALLATADAAYGDVLAPAKAWRRDAEEMVAAMQNGEFASVFAAFWSPAVQFSGPNGLQGEGYGQIIEGLKQDLNHGVRSRLTNVVASRDLAVWEFGLLNPPEDPYHCPPGAVWVLHSHSGRVNRFRLFHARRPSPERTRTA
jgi:RNA polymerase sigma-70 factor (ECF subfamily)